ncbi:MAG: non-canonical purine NTP pyrophosphatase, partial [Methylophilaceae bacterium]
MTPILIATQNPGKLREFESLLTSQLNPLAPDDRSPQVVEDGVTYHENALKKAKAFYEVYKIPVLSDDSGLEIDVLSGAPGIWSARFGGENISWAERFQK